MGRMERRCLSFQVSVICCLAVFQTPERGTRSGRNFLLLFRQNYALDRSSKNNKPHKQVIEMLLTHLLLRKSDIVNKIKSKY